MNLPMHIYHCICISITMFMVANSDKWLKPPALCSAWMQCKYSVYFQRSRGLPLEKKAALINLCLTVYAITTITLKMFLSCTVHGQLQRRCGFWTFRRRLVAVHLNNRRHSQIWRLQTKRLNYCLPVTIKVLCLTLKRLEKLVQKVKFL